MTEVTDKMIDAACDAFGCDQDIVAMKLMRAAIEAALAAREPVDKQWYILWDNEAGPGWDWIVIIPGYENIVGLSESIARQIVSDHNS